MTRTAWNARPPSWPAPSTWRPRRSWRGSRCSSGRARRATGATDYPGCPGRTGEKGRDGTHGRDGVDGLHGKDGLGFDDLGTEYDERGRLYLVFRRGAEEKRFFVTGAFQGKFTEGDSYKRGDSVIWAGSGWTALVDTDGSVKPDAPVKDGPRIWQLHVMRGKQGEKGLRGERGTDGVSGRDGRDLNQRW